jgi:hypothetical protein
VRVARRLQVAEQPRREGAARVPGTANRAAGPHDLTGVPPAAQRLLAHQSTVRWLVRARDWLSSVSQGTAQRRHRDRPRGTGA